MGNYVSCSLRAIPGGARPATKVILPGGRVRRVDGRAAAAELMLEAPGHFLADVRAMQVGRRLAALAADEDLEIGHVYVMLPMKRLNAVVGAPDMARLLLAADKEARRASGGSARVLPGSPPQEEATTTTTAMRAQVDYETDDDSIAAGEMKYRMSASRSRRPTLETIEEESFSLISL
ncbi:hypothetical protein ACMD2_27464 [Ananas comosus]|uniref:Uncharacterized protein n=1 Tax=Ananas comosus TaxID=4615 RepID=A0A199W1L8_ANACO|nr:hypothetical protein ACMD2_27464 [Ananas comosus]